MIETLDLVNAANLNETGRAPANIQVDRDTALSLSFKPELAQTVKNILSGPTTFGAVSTSATLANTPVTSATPVSTVNESPQSLTKAREAVFDTVNPIDRRCPTRAHHSVFCLHRR